MRVRIMIPKKGGSGGPGGSGCTRYDTDGDGNTTTYYNPGGYRGRDGFNGRHETSQLFHGNSGSAGTLAINTVADTQVSYNRRYDLQIKDFVMLAPYQVNEHSNTFQWGDTVSINNICAKNVGGMPTPSTDSKIEIIGRKFIAPLIGDQSYLKGSLSVGQTEYARGSLAFHISKPSTALDALGEDHDPYCERVTLSFNGFQLGPYGGQHFSRRYPEFDVSGKSLAFRFPIENPKGFTSLRSLRLGETIRVHLPLNNISDEDIGQTTQRQLMIQFRRLESPEVCLLPSLLWLLCFLETDSIAFPLVLKQ